MFDGFETKTDAHSRKRFAASSGASLVVCLLVGAGAIAIASRPQPPKKEEVVEVSFRQPKAEAKPEPPPPPPPPEPEPKPKPQKAAAPEVDISAPATPTAIPAGELREGDEAGFRASGALSDLTDSAIGVVGGDETAAVPPPPPPPPEAPRRRPVILPDGASPPRPRASNPEPSYPEQARRAGLEGLVLLEVVIDEEGHVRQVEVVQGKEPFSSAAVAAVERWSYQPAKVRGRPVAVHRMIRVPFRLKS